MPLTAWWRPTLARRVIGALLLAFLLFALAALLQDQVDIRRQMTEEPGVRVIGWQVAAALRDVDDERQAARVVAGLARFANQGRHRTPLLPGDLLFQLYDAAGRRVYTSADTVPIGRIGFGEQSLLGRSHWTYRQDGERWSVRVAEPVIPSTDLLGFSSWELAKVLLWGFPLMLLPLWVAVRTGLSPLRRFAREMDGMDANQRLAPLGMDLRYGELRPLGRAFDALLARLRERQAREQAFVHDAAHELRTPLAVVAAQAHVLVNAADAPARAAAAAALREAVAQRPSVAAAARPGRAGRRRDPPARGAGPGRAGGPPAGRAGRAGARARHRAVAGRARPPAGPSGPRGL